MEARSHAPIGLFERRVSTVTDVDTRRIGELDVSLLGLGCNNFGQRCDEEQSAAVVHAALDAGVTFFDTADIYGEGLSEDFLGKALKGSRDDVVVCTKWSRHDLPTGFTGGARESIRFAVDASLYRLDTDWIDVYVLHRPDPEVDIDETLAALDELVVAGKVREIGCSNHDADQIASAAEAAASQEGARYTSVQNRYSVLYREPEAEVLEACEKYDLSFIPYFPLESGLLTGKVPYDGEPERGTRLGDWPDDGRFLSDAFRAQAKALDAYARSVDRTILELALNWLASKPRVSSIIAGATQPEQVQANAASLGWSMTVDDVGEIDEIVAATASPQTRGTQR